MKYHKMLLVTLLALALAATPSRSVYSQMGGGYTCATFQRMDAGTRGFPALVPYGSENDPNSWWVISTADGNLLVDSTGEEIDPIASYGRSVWVWYPSFASGSTNALESIGSYEWVASCGSVATSTDTPFPQVVPLSISFWADNTTIMAGQCTVLHWSIAGSGVSSIYIGDQVVPPTGDASTCLASSATIPLTVYSSQGNQASTVTINVFSATDTPLPQLPPNPLPAPPLEAPVAPPPASHDTANDQGAAPGDGYEPGLSWFDRLVPPVEAGVRSYTSAECQARFTAFNCTWFVAGQRPDVCQWIKPGQGNAYLWTSQAQQNGGSLGITVRTKPQAGDIAVWPAGCGGTSPIPPNGNCTIGPSGNYEGCGHVAYVTAASPDGTSIDIQEYNWGTANAPNSRTIAVSRGGCLRFISPASPNAPLAPKSSSQQPGAPGSPTSKPTTLWGWFLNLFRSP